MDQANLHKAAADDPELFKWFNTHMTVRTYSDLNRPPKSIKEVCNSRDQTFLIRPYVETFGSYKLTVYWWKKGEWHWQIWTPTENAHIYWEVCETGTAANSRDAKRDALSQVSKRDDLTESERHQIEIALEKHKKPN